MKKQNKPKEKEIKEEIPEEKKKIRNYIGNHLFKQDDGSIYYGEIKFLSEYGNVIQDVEVLNEEEQSKLKLVRHGFGVQLFDATSDGKYSAKYEGEWNKDKKNGKGKIVYKNGEIYEGNFLNNIFYGYGEFKWITKDIYKGQWVNGKMEGKGEFIHRDEFAMSGNFVGDYYVNSKGIFINPFTPKSMIKLFESKSLEYLKKIEANDNETFSTKNIFKIQLSDYKNQVEKSYKDNRIPMIILSQE